MTELLEGYSPGLLAFLVRTRRVSDDVAEEILQSFITDKILIAHILHRADRERGRFRNFVLKSLSNYAATWLTRENRNRHRSLDHAAVPIKEADEAACFDREWSWQLVQDALQLMQAECVERELEGVWHVFERRVVWPLTRGTKPVSYAEIVEYLQLSTPRQAINLLATAKRSFQRHLLAAATQFHDLPEDAGDELVELQKLLRT